MYISLIKEVVLLKKEQNNIILNTIYETFSKKQIKTILYIASALWLALGTQYMVNRIFKEKVKITEAFVKIELEEMGLKEQQMSLEYTGSYNGALAQREKEK